MNLPFDLDAEIRKLIASKSIELPPYPGVALQLQRILQGKDYGIDQLAKLVEADQALAAAVMRSANSAFFWDKEPVTTLVQAIGRIGARDLANIAIAGTLGLSANENGPLSELRREAWKYSVVCALVAQTLAKGRQVASGEAFLGGLLHAFGETIAYACVEVLLEAYPKTEAQPAQAWAEVGKKYQVELGTILAAEWKLPLFVQQVVAHYQAEVAPAGPHQAVVSLISVSARASRRLLEAATIEQAGLDQVAGLTPAERPVLEKLVPGIPAFLSSFGGPQSAPTPPPSAVKKSALPQSPNMRAVEFPVVIARKNGTNETYQAVQWAPGALRFVGKQPQPERHLVVLNLPGFKATATIAQCVSSGPDYEIEVKPFAMDKATSAAWEQLGQAPPKA